MVKLVVSAGSYERILYGIDVQVPSGSDKAAPSVKESFAIPAHTGYIKAITSCPRFLVSGGTDEIIRLFDLCRRRDVGSLTQHQGPVTALAFVGSTHLLSGGEDGRISLFRTKDWECLHVLRHKKPIHSLAVHPTGKLAISVGKERSLKLWNLMTAKQAHSTTLPVEPLRILFSETGKYYAVLGEKELLLYDTASSRLIRKHVSKTRLATAAFLRDHVVYAAGEGSLVQIIPVADDDQTTTILDTLQTPRIKDLAIYSDSTMDMLVTGSSSGTIKGWHLPANPADGPKALFAHEARIRITCLTVTPFSS